MNKIIVRFKGYIPTFLCYGINFIIPIAMFKVISDEFSKEHLAIFFTHLAVIFYLQYIVEYGFQTSLLKVSHKINNNLKKTSQLLYTVITFRVIVSLVLMLASYSIINTLPLDNSYFKLYLILFGNIFSLIFFFQSSGLINNYYIISTIVKLPFLPIIYKSNDIITIYTLYNVIPNFILFLYFIFKRKLFEINIKISYISLLLKRTSRYFISNTSITLYTNFNQVMLAFFHPLSLPAYAISDKIIRAIVSGNYIFTQILQIEFLNKDSIFNEEKRANAVKLFLVLSILELTFLLFLSYFISNYVYINIANMFYILSLMTLIVPIILMSNLIGMVFLTCLNKTHLLSAAFLFSSVVSCITSPILTYTLSSWGGVINTILAESLVLCTCIYYYKRSFR